MGIVPSQLVALTTRCRHAPWGRHQRQARKVYLLRIHESRRNVGINSLQVVAHAEGLPLMERTEAGMLEAAWVPVNLYPSTICGAKATQLAASLIPSVAKSEKRKARDSPNDKADDRNDND